MLKILSSTVDDISIGIFERIWKISQLRELLLLLDSHIKTVHTNFGNFYQSFDIIIFQKWIKSSKPDVKCQAIQVFQSLLFILVSFATNFHQVRARENSNPNLWETSCDVKSFLMTFWKIITMEWRI